MKYSLLRGGIAALMALGVVVVVGAGSPSGHARGISYAGLNPIQKKLVSGALAQALGPASVSSQGAASHAAATVQCVNPVGGGEEADEADNECAPDSFAPTSGGGASGSDPNFTPSGQGGCSETLGDNVKVNQNCQNVADSALAGRSQAQNEEAIAIDPMNPNHMVASQNDYRRGDGNCYGAYSLDGGRSLERHDDPDVVHVRVTDVGRSSPVLAGGRRHVGRVGHEGQRVLQLPGVQPRGERRQLEPRPVERVLRLPLDRQRRRVVELPGPADRRVQRHRGRGNRARGQGVHDGRQPRRQPVPGSDLRHLDGVRGGRDRPTSTKSTRATTARRSRPRCSSARTARSARSPTACSESGRRRESATRTSSRTRSPAPTAPSTSPGRTTTTPRRPDRHRRQPLPGTAREVDRRRRDVLRRRSRSATTTTCPTASPTRTPTRAARACRRRARRPTRSSGRRTIRSGSVNPKQPEPGRRHASARTSTRTRTSRTAARRPASTRTRPAALHRREDAGACNNDILISVSNDGGATFTGTRADPRTEATVNPDPDQATDGPVLAVGGVRQERQARRRLLRPPVRQAGTDGAGPQARRPGHAARRAGCPPTSSTASPTSRSRGARTSSNWGTTARDLVVDAAADAVRRPVLRRLHRHGRAATRPHRSGPTPATPSSSSARDAGPPTDLHGRPTRTPTGPLQANDENSYMAVDGIPTK